MTSVKKNIFLNGINTLTSIVFPVITFPYAARVLLPEGIGAVNFLNSIIAYIVLLTSLGIPMYAVKEVAKYRDDKPKRDRITVEILLLSTFLCLIGYVGVCLLAEFIPQIHRQQALFYVLSLTIVFNTIGVNWFYQAVEDFKFITIRAVIFRTLSATALFTFVKEPSDLLIYGFIIVGSTVGNNLINFIHLRKHVTISSICVKDLRIWRHLVPAMQVFILNLIISLYIQLNSIMLGFISGDDAVGYFTAGTRISHIALTIITSLGTVMLPRCSHLIATGDMNGFGIIIRKSLNLTLALSMPMTVGLMVLAAPVTIIFCGAEFSDAIPVLLLNAPVVIFISLTNVMGIQVLYPMDKIKLVIWSVTGGAAINLILNFILIPSLGATGAAWATLFAELVVIFLQMVLGRKCYPFSVRSFFNWKYIVASLIMGAVVYTENLLLDADWLKVVVGILSGTIVYVLCLYVFKASLFKELKII